MGEEIEAAGFTKKDFARFANRLSEEMRIARELFADDRFSQSGYTLGFEVESWILDHNYFPSPINQQLLEAMADPQVVPELSRFNIELNCEPLPLTGDVLSRAFRALSAVWEKCNRIAHGLDANMIMIGTLPTIRDEDLTLANMSPLNRYYALNAEVLRRRGGRPLCVDIEGREHLRSEHRDVMLEAATTSFQVHLKAPAGLMRRYYNASVAASGPVLAICGNAPFLFGKSLWEETRIPLFEKAVDVPGARGECRRVSMGEGYVERCCLEIFEENARDYHVLLPMAFDDPPETLRHLRLHNGTIWRWNRPLIGFEDDGAPHLRIEHRTLPAGPTIRDMIANTALYIGLAHSLALNDDVGAGGLSYAQACENFYAAARHGLDATLLWPGLGAVGAQRLLLDHLLPQARAGLAGLGVEQGDWLDVIEARLNARMTGSRWQREAFEARGRNVYELMAAYCERQRSGAPVHEWEP
jgi:gamma-glutamyl:cysteine ligase YbdK (ATP-grasp superfamily)